ncbi:MAG TPA: ATP-dependent DNA helicase UvrD2 [Acidimicrobiales bacterium]
MPVPGPAALGRGVVVAAGDAVPAPWSGAPEVVVDDAAVAEPVEVVGRLHRAWAAREPVVVRLAADPARFRSPASWADPPWALGPRFEVWGDRLHFLVWANTYDARGGGEPVWWWARKAARLGAEEAGAGADGDVVLPGGRPAWVDGGPRGPLDPGEVGGAVVSRETVDLGRLDPAPPPTAPSADLAPDQLAAVAHGAGPARVVAPAGSGKTRVLTERLRHVLVDRGWEREAVLAVAYNKQAQVQLEERTADVHPRTRTLNSLGLSVVAAANGRMPRVMDEREVRDLVASLVPLPRRRVNTDPLGPYVEALSLVRLGLRDPEDVEASRDDVPGLAAAVEPFRAALAATGAVDFDEQVYGAVAALLGDGELRRRLQGTHRHLLVDEFQDLTPAHVLLLRLLSAPAFDVFGVGDDDQTVYSHAGADPAFLLDYGDLFPGAASHALEVNYRCPAAVVTGALRLLGRNDRRLPKDVRPGPAADPDPAALALREHAPEEGATAVVEAVRAWLDEGAVPSEVAVLTRVNSLLLAPQVALGEAGVPVSSVLRADVLERTGVRAALAYLRIGASPDAIRPGDVVEVLRRPSRGLPPWFSDRLRNRRRLTLTSLRAIAGTVTEKDGAKVEALADDLEAVALAVANGTTRQVLLAVRDGIGLGRAMTLLDGSRGGDGSSHLDDLEALLQVADLHPDPATFEPWLRAALGRPAAPDGVTLSTVHRVKGREWDRVVVAGVTAGLLPHRLAEDEEEERRVLHVAVTRARRRAVVLGDRSRPSPFLAELAGTAPPKSERRVAAAPAAPAGGPRRSDGRAAAAVPSLAAEPGLAVTVPGGFEGTVDGRTAAGTVVALARGGRLTVRWGEPVIVDGRRVTLTDPEAGAVEERLRAWRLERARKDGVPAYVVFHDRTLQAIAAARPATLEELARQPGIGPTKLERYGDEVLAVLGGDR